MDFFLVMGSFIMVYYSIYNGFLKREATVFSLLLEMSVIYCLFIFLGNC